MMDECGITLCDVYEKMTIMWFELKSELKEYKEAIAAMASHLENLKNLILEYRLHPDGKVDVGLVREFLSDTGALKPPKGLQ